MPEATSSTIAPKKDNAPTPVRELARFFLPLLRPYWKELGVAIVAILLGSSVSVLQPWPLKVVIDLLLSHRHHSRVPLLRAASAAHRRLARGSTRVVVLVANTRTAQGRSAETRVGSPAGRCPGSSAAPVLGVGQRPIGDLVPAFGP